MKNLWSARIPGVAMFTPLRIGVLLAMLFARALPMSAAENGAPQGQLIVVRGASGTAEYGSQFDAWAAQWRTAAQRMRLHICEVGTTGNSAAENNDRQRLQQMIAGAVAPNALEQKQPIWLVFLGHGTFDGKTARFNLRGPDVTADDLAAWLQVSTRPTVIINTASCSGAFLQPLAGPGRVVITATKNGHEHHACRFGGDLSEAINDMAADLDKDGGVSLLEAYLQAVRKTEAAYKLDGRLATEHAVLDDNGDGVAVDASAFDGVRPRSTGEIQLVGNRPAMVDGVRSQQVSVFPSPAESRLTLEQRRRRDELELAVLQLREHRAEWDEAEYLAHLEAVLLQLAEVYEASEPSETRQPATAESGHR